MRTLYCRPWVCSVQPWPQDSSAPSCASLAFLQRRWRRPTKEVSADPGLGSVAPEAVCLGSSLFVAVSDVEAFAKAMQNNAKSEPKEGDTKDKKDEEEDMSLD